MGFSCGKCGKDLMPLAKNYHKNIIDVVLCRECYESLDDDPKALKAIIQNALSFLVTENTYHTDINAVENAVKVLRDAL